MPPPRAITALLLLPLAGLLAATGVPPPEFHTFSDQFGHTFVGQISEVNGSQVKVRRDDGQDFTVEVAKLSEADAAYVARWQRDHVKYQLQMDASTFHVTVGSATRAGSTTIQTMEAGYEIKLTNNSRADTAALRVEYNLFALRLSQVSMYGPGGQNGQNGRNNRNGRNGPSDPYGASSQDVMKIESAPLRITGAMSLASVALKQTVTFKTSRLPYTKSLSLADVFESGQLVGVWVRVLFEDRVVAEFFSNENLKNQGWQAVPPPGGPKPGG